MTGRDSISNRLARIEAALLVLIDHFSATAKEEMGTDVDRGTLRLMRHLTARQRGIQDNAERLSEFIDGLRRMSAGPEGRTSDAD